jgi:hypothetical protein
MEQDGIEYTVVQTINPLGWKWSFEREGRKAKTGIAFSRAEPISAARRAISLSVKQQGRQQRPPASSVGGLFP